MELLSRLKRDTTTRNKLVLTILIMFAILIGYRIPLPGINTDYLKTMSSMLSSSGLGGFLNVLTGSSLSQMSIFALSITPYITASIVLQLLSVAIPALEAMSKDGSVGHQKMERLTFAVGVLVAIIESIGLAVGFGKNGLFNNYSWYMVLYASAVWTIGACFLMWLGQYITKNLIGNGTSLILVFNILTTLPNDIINLFMTVSDSYGVAAKILVGLAIFAVFVLVFAYVCVLNRAEKRIRITNSGKSGQRMTGADDNIMPMKVNIGGVMPIIFASSIMSFPILIASFFEIKDGSFWHIVINSLNQGNWFKLDTPIYTIGVLLFSLLVFAFSYFYMIISFNTKDIADNLRKGGSIINGIRPGQPTADYLNQQVKSVLWIGTFMLLLVALIPTILSGVFNLPSISFGGTTAIILVGTILDMHNAIYAQTSSVAYKSLVRKRGLKR